MATLNMKSIQPVILCGGAGTRLWPMSRSTYPKQFLCLDQEQSLFQNTLTRVNSFSEKSAMYHDPIIVTNEEHRFLALEQLRQSKINPRHLILEPARKNTAPALTLAALASQSCGDDPILIVAPSDHKIANQKAYNQSIGAAIEKAEDGFLVTLGIKPEYPETGFGYIKTENLESRQEKFNSYEVKDFIEKPNLDIAEELVRGKNWFWNSGIFILKASVWLNAVSKYSNQTYVTISNAWNGRVIDDYFIRPAEEIFLTSPAVSIDYAVMENRVKGNSKTLMVELIAGWNDLGSWDSVWRTSKKDGLGNSLNGDVFAQDSKNNLIYANNKLVAVMGLNDIVIIETPDALLVADKAYTKNLRDLVDDLNTKLRQEAHLHRKVYRPWGWYDCVDYGENFKVKRIQVNPGGSLSLQKHMHRAEHWIVVKGKAEIICGSKKINLEKNQSTYIPLGAVHRLTNPGDEALEIIEVQSGEYLEEDDIVRLEDSYGRK